MNLFGARNNRTFHPKDSLNEANAVISSTGVMASDIGFTH